MDYLLLGQYIQQAARERGIDPIIALKVASSEGYRPETWQSNVYKTVGNRRLREPSYGPFQLLVGGPGTGFPTGLGNQFKEQTGLDPSDPANIKQEVNFALDHAKSSGWGEWYGAKAAGISPWQGIKGVSIDSTPNPAPTAVASHQPPNPNKAFSGSSAPMANTESAQTMQGAMKPASVPSIQDPSMLSLLGQGKFKQAGNLLSNKLGSSGGKTGLSLLASAMGGGSHQQSAPPPAPNLLNDGSDAARAQAAQQLMDSLMKKNSPYGLTLMG